MGDIRPRYAQETCVLSQNINSLTQGILL